MSVDVLSSQVGKRTRSEMETPEKRYNFKVTPITAQGLAVWSVSPQAVSDLPDVTAIQRCAVAIARRLIVSIAERFVKNRQKRVVKLGL